ncbi:YesK family protein [Bacillus sp. JCM 19041]|uniref:YesK family protein n=1 Tax=Bacillus sp. JCM 19041 TaxID=1460637 RepID=UPI0006D26A41
MEKSNVLMLEGWTPMLLIGLASGLILFFISKKISKKAITVTVISLTLAYIATVAYSYIVVRGWEGIGLFALSTIIIFFVWVGSLLGFVTKTKASA